MGGTDAKKAARLVKGSCDVVVGTTGRVLDFIEKGLLKTSAVRLLVSGRVFAGGAAAGQRSGIDSVCLRQLACEVMGC